MNIEAILAWAVNEIVIPRIRRAVELIETTQKGLVETPYPPASSPGSPPNLRTANLHGHIKHTEPRLERLTVVAENFVDEEAVPYALPLEHGTNRMAARPFFTLGIELAKPEVNAIVAGGL